MKIDKSISYDVGVDWEKLVHVESVLNTQQFLITYTFKTIVDRQKRAF
jgi:hypothetical protein